MPGKGLLLRTCSSYRLLTPLHPLAPRPFLLAFPLSSRYLSLPLAPVFLLRTIQPRDNESKERHFSIDSWHCLFLPYLPARGKKRRRIIRRATRCGGRVDERRDLFQAEDDNDNARGLLKIGAEEIAMVSTSSRTPGSKGSDVAPSSKKRISADRGDLPPTLPFLLSCSPRREKPGKKTRAPRSSLMSRSTSARATVFSRIAVIYGRIAFRGPPRERAARRSRIESGHGISGNSRGCGRVCNLERWLKFWNGRQKLPPCYGNFPARGLGIIL